MRAMVRGMVGRGKKTKDKNGGVVPPTSTVPPTNSNTKHAKIQPSFSCSPPMERRDSRPAAVQVNPANHSVGSPPARRQPPKRIPSGKGTSNQTPGVVKTDLAVKVCVHCKSDRADHELPPNQALNVYNRLGIQPPGTPECHNQASPKSRCPDQLVMDTHGCHQDSPERRLVVLGKT
ncbi:Protein CBG16953 [Caenorhabditis briggsae]|uniref:Protein CBG16953 n=1 Tax=Caenorhabditis briggsae TaxID=6238 RepID=A8XQ48_CAEBR|nr:Protein CBG16953 [Caenorhabditis briggsae]CAP34773.1 Protein CBG16953 [Caenorhabditis briggsae]